MSVIMSEQYYIAVKASLHSTDSSVFGLDPVEISALSKRFPNSQTPVFNGILIKGIIITNTIGRTYLGFGKKEIHQGYQCPEVQIGL